MLVTKTNSFSRGQISGFGARIAADPASSPMLVSKSKLMQAWPDLWIWSTDGNFYHFPCKEFMKGRAMHKFQISRRSIMKPQLQVAWPVAMFIKDNHVMSSRPPRTEMTFPGQTGSAGTQAASFSKPRWPFYQG